MVETINCTLSHFDWIMEGVPYPLPPCENNTKSLEVIKVSCKHVYKLLNGPQRVISEIYIPCKESGFDKTLENCDTPCQWTDFTPRLTNYEESYYQNNTFFSVAYLTTTVVHQNEVHP